MKEIETPLEQKVDISVRFTVRPSDVQIIEQKIVDAVHSLEEYWGFKMEHGDIEII